MYELDELKLDLIKLINLLLYLPEYRNEYGLEMIKIITPDLDEDIVVLLIQDILDYLFEDEEDLEEIGGIGDEIAAKVRQDLDDYLEDEAPHAPEVNESIKFKSIKERKLLKKKKELLKKLGDRAKTLEFKRNYYFDKKLKRFVKRDKPLDIKTIKKKAKVMKKLMKKSEFKNKIKRAKEHYKQIGV
jgi:hypothetical protein